VQICRSLWHRVECLFIERQKANDSKCGITVEYPVLVIEYFALISVAVLDGRGLTTTTQQASNKLVAERWIDEESSRWRWVSNRRGRAIIRGGQVVQRAMMTDVSFSHCGPVHYTGLHDQSIPDIQLALLRYFRREMMDSRGSTRIHLVVEFVRQLSQQPMRPIEWHKRRTLLEWIIWSLDVAIFILFDWTPNFSLKFPT